MELITDNDNPIRLNLYERMISEEARDVQGIITITKYKVDDLEFDCRSDAENYLREKEEKEIESQLLPCPACNHEAKLYQHDNEWLFGIQCNKCRIQTRALNRSKRGAMFTWNQCQTKRKNRDETQS